MESPPGSTALPSIRITDNPLQPVRSGSVGPSNGFDLRPVSTADGGGIYNPRSSFDRRSARRLSQSNAQDIEEGDDWRDERVKEKQVFRGTTLLWLSYQSIGTIYGDIGTSPLYVYSSTFTSAPSWDDLVGVLSIIIWSMTIVVTIKYVFIILHADNAGEGGTFSTLSLLSRYANIMERDPREQATVRMERHLSRDLSSANRNLRAKIEKSMFTRGLLKIIGVLALSMTISDGVLTPAQSVLGAVQGLEIVKPDLERSAVVGTTCGILILLFLIQPLGTTKLSSTFAPIVITWLGFNGAFGIYNLIKHDHVVLKAFSPYFAIQFFVRHGTEGWKMLGGVLLAFTGVEALFADLGAFSLHAIQLSWMCYVYPCLLLAYIGQAAHISAFPDAYSNPFFASCPPGMFYPSLVLAVLAAIVASQAMITATFQLISQLLKLSYCPQVKVVHTSKIFHGQIYVPFLNWLLMIGCILVTAIFQTTDRLGALYGTAVMFVTTFDTLMVTLVSLIVWKLSPFLVFIPWLAFASVDGLFLTSALIKVPEGAWFTLLLAGIMACLFILWRYGKENQWMAEAEDRFKPSHIVTKSDDGKLRLTEHFGSDTLSTIRGFGIFFDKTGVLTPSVFTHFVSKFVAIPDIAVFFHLHPVEAPTVPPEERYAVSNFTAVPGCYRLVIKHGFMDEVISPDLAALIYEQVRKFIIRQAVQRLGAQALEKEGLEREQEDDPISASSTDKGNHPHRRLNSSTVPIELQDEKTAAELARLDRAYAAKIMYIVGKEQMRVKRSSHIFRRACLELFLWIRENTRAKIANLRLAMDRVVEVGFVKEI